MAGSSTAAQFLQRFTNDVPWVHLDIAGTAMGSPKNAISRTWASGYGVRLLDRLVKALLRIGPVRERDTVLPFRASHRSNKRFAGLAGKNVSETRLEGGCANRFA